MMTADDGRGVRAQRLFQALIDSMRFPPGCHALFDPIGGTIQALCSREAYERIHKSTYQQMTEESDQFVQTLMHERLHYLQTCTFGFLYELSMQLFLRIVKLLPTDSDDKIQIESLAPSDREELESVLSRVDERPTGSLSARDIIESLTTYQQVLIRTGLTVDVYKEILTHLGAGSYDPFAQMIDHFTSLDTYRRAYLVAVEHFREHAFVLFPYTACLSLCTQSPARSFEPLCEAVWRRVTTAAGAASEKTSLAAFGWLGFAHEVAIYYEEKGLFRHPSFVEVAADWVQSSFDAQSRPDAMALAHLVRAVEPPTLLYESTDSGPVPYRSNAATDKITPPSFSFVVSAVGQKVFSQLNRH